MAADRLGGFVAGFRARTVPRHSVPRGSMSRDRERIALRSGPIEAGGLSGCGC